MVTDIPTHTGEKPFKCTNVKKLGCIDTVWGSDERDELTVNGRGHLGVISVGKILHNQDN